MAEKLIVAQFNMNLSQGISLLVYSTTLNILIYIFTKAARLNVKSSPNYLKV